MILDPVVIYGAGSRAARGRKKALYYSNLMDNDETTAKREFSNLLQIEDNHRKYVVTLDDISAGVSKDGVIRLSLLDFLITDQ